MIAGVPPQPGFTAPKLMWLKAHEPLVFAKINKILLPKDFITLWLTGCHVTDTSDAAGTLWLDQGKREWSSLLCDASDVDLNWLPPLLNGFDKAGEVTSLASTALGVPKGIPVFAGGGRCRCWCYFNWCDNTRAVFHIARNVWSASDC